ncbi:MGH1-like glycoside hydrolase domain-containing protein [Hufsiella ginkgonis]|uniref:Glycoside hydrolase n=1 Tax=Hufsiella ginkgonis TaxID=2695274 RepID=A0A7K1XWJ7_9SPHI|nr:glycosyl hydrolase family 65 protein [Hufsiella ginkgonis]MXV15187.1 glycoside hydrolase [Hufsiella ginkgonis]
MMTTIRKYLIITLFFVVHAAYAQQKSLINTAQLKPYIDSFNAEDPEAVKNFISNDQSLAWLSANIPLFDCPDSAIQKVYYYRWWTFRKHLKQTPEGFIFTEFITPVNHAGKYNAVSSALGHQVFEGRWLRDPKYISDYISFWLYVDPKHTKPVFHGFSSWVDYAVYHLYLVNLDKSFVQKNLAALDADYARWETEKREPGGLFWQFDVKDAMEESISGSRKDKNVRPTINSYMYGNAMALSAMAKLTGDDNLQKKYAEKAADLKSKTDAQLWDNNASFYKVKFEKGGFSDAREEIGFIPWYFNLPEDKAAYAKQWSQLLDPAGFNAPWGITTAERRHPLFRTHGSGHGCEWDGAVWPFATTQTLKGLANLLTDYKVHGKMNAAVYYNELHKYAMSHQMGGKIYIGEYQDEKNGEWLKGDNPRSRFYNHSGFADLVINDLVGLKARPDDILEINPLIPQGEWDWFCLDKVRYHGKDISILWDKTGRKYGKGKGFRLFADGREIYSGKKVSHVQVKL